MPPKLQAKLLRVLEYQEVERVGRRRADQGQRARAVGDATATWRPPSRLGTFRRDLFYRLNRVTLRLPPLRERLDDLPELAAYFLARAAERTGPAAPMLAEAALERLRAYPWPGNIRELQNVLYRAVGVCRGPRILPTHLHLPEAGGRPQPVPETAEDEALAGLRRAVAWAWDRHEGKVWPELHDLLERELLAFALARLNQTQAADRIGMARGTVNQRAQKYGLK